MSGRLDLIVAPDLSMEYDLKQFGYSLRDVSSSSRLFGQETDKIPGAMLGVNENPSALDIKVQLSLCRVIQSLSIARRGDYCLWVMKNLSHEYKRHDLEETILYKVLEEHVQTFFDMLSSDPDRKPLPSFVKREFDKFLSCGVLSEGFVRVKCGDCVQSTVVEFSCKCRVFCPSCAGRRMSERAFNMSDHIIPCVPTRHWFFRILLSCAIGWLLMISC